MLKFARRIIRSASRFVPFLWPIKKTIEPIREIAGAPADKMQWIRPQVLLVLSNIALGVISQSPLFFIFAGCASAYTTWFLIRPKSTVGSEEHEKFLPVAAGIHLFLSFLVLMHLAGGPI